MGNCLSCSRPPAVYHRGRVLKLAPWELNPPITRAELERMRQEFWTRPHTKGKKENWEALEAASLVLINASGVQSFLAQSILDKAGLQREFSDMRVCYDKRGVKYELPLYVLGEPTNLID